MLDTVAAPPVLSLWGGRMSMHEPIDVTIEPGDAARVYDAVHSAFQAVGLEVFDTMTQFWGVFGDGFNERISRGKKTPTVDMTDFLIAIFDGLPDEDDIDDPDGWDLVRPRLVSPEFDVLRARLRDLSDSLKAARRGRPAERARARWDGIAMELSRGAAQAAPGQSPPVSAPAADMIEGEFCARLATFDFHLPSSNYSPERGRPLLVEYGFDRAEIHIEDVETFVVEVDRCEMRLELGQATAEVPRHEIVVDHLQGAEHGQLRMRMRGRAGYRYWEVDNPASGKPLAGEYPLTEVCLILGALGSEDRIRLTAAKHQIAVRRESGGETTEKSRVIDELIKLYALRLDEEQRLLFGRVRLVE